MGRSRITNMKVIKKQTSSKDCIICGVDNPAGVHADFYELEDGSLCALFSFKSIHQSYPSRTHGGMISAMIDETIGRLLWMEHPDQYAVTMKLSIEYHQPVPYNVPLKCVAKFKNQSSMTFEGEAEIRSMDDKMLAKGTALYFKLPLSRISGDNINPEEFNIMVPDDTKEI